MIGGISLHRPGLPGLLQQRHLLASALAILIHIVGFVGMVWIDRSWFSALTPVNLLLMSLLLVWTYSGARRPLLFFLLIAFVTGLGVEMIGVNTALLFGRYAYGQLLGPQLAGVPLIIGMNWFAVMLGAASLAHAILPVRPNRKEMGRLARIANDTWFAGVAASLAVAFDWVMEPAAVKLGLWHWLDGEGIPMLNYICWFGVAFLLTFCLRAMHINTSQRFPRVLLLIQTLFFLLIEWFA